jgi:hypothetical protein
MHAACNKVGWVNSMAEMGKGHEEEEQCIHQFLKKIAGYQAGNRWQGKVGKL